MRSSAPTSPARFPRSAISSSASVTASFCEWRWRGQTIGKRLLRLRVVDAEGMRLQFNQIVTRNLLRFVDSLPAFYFVGGLACWLSPKCQRLGDIAANTIVIRNPRVASRTSTNCWPASSTRCASIRTWPRGCGSAFRRPKPPWPCRRCCAATSLTRWPASSCSPNWPRTSARKVGFPARSHRRHRRRTIPAQCGGRDLSHAHR